VISCRLIEGKIYIGSEVFEGSEIVVVPESPHIFKLNGVKYRGRLKILVEAGETSLSLRNEVPLKPYLAGVIGAEMPSYWEAAALEAQAVVARTYCLYIKQRFGVNRSWDVRRSEASQVYLGMSGECNAVWSAVNGTAGEVLYGVDSQGNDGLLPTYYSSSCGGHTEDSEQVFGDSFPSLAGVACDYCRKVARPKFFFWPMVRIDKDEVSRRLIERYPNLAELEKIVEIAVVRKSEYKHFTRWTFIKLIGENGKHSFVRAEDFRLSVDPSGRKLRSTAWEMVDLQKQWGFLSGRGYGHGVGMCQCGAEGMAREGKTAKEILSHYYPGSRVRNIY
jgi:stage II sporulation protein D